MGFLLLIGFVALVIYGALLALVGIAVLFDSMLFLQLFIPFSILMVIYTTIRKMYKRPKPKRKEFSDHGAYLPKLRRRTAERRYRFFR